jgi:hypothetical protein
MIGLDNGFSDGPAVRRHRSLRRARAPVGKSFRLGEPAGWSYDDRHRGPARGGGRRCNACARPQSGRYRPRMRFASNKSLQKRSEQHAADAVKPRAFRTRQVASLARVQQQEFELLHHHLIRWSRLRVTSCIPGVQLRCERPFRWVDALHWVMRSWRTHRLNCPRSLGLLSAAASAPAPATTSAAAAGAAIGRIG